MPGVPTVSKAQFLKQTAAHPRGDESTVVTVHFNPVSLKYIISNTLKKVGRGNRAKQHVTKSTGKLSMQLVFDTTDTGEDVGIYTQDVADYMEPVNKVPPTVKFRWGTFVFTGMVEKYQETIDYFSADGVPLRASISLTIANQDTVFPEDSEDADALRENTGEQVNLRPAFSPTTSSGGSAGNGGGAGTGIGAGASMGASAGISAGFGGGISTGAGVSASAGISGSVGFGINASAGLGVSGSIGSSVGVSTGLSGTAGFGGSASAGINASQGAFSGLRTNISAPSVSSNSVVEIHSTQSLSTGANAGFGIGGKAEIRGASSLKADVGGSGSLQSRISFNED